MFKHHNCVDSMELGAITLWEVHAWEGNCKILWLFYQVSIFWLLWKKFTNFPLYQILHIFTSKSQVIFSDKYGFKGSILYNWF